VCNSRTKKKSVSVSVILGVKNLVNKGNLKGRRRTANKGLSPVIAAVILIAVTVAIAVAAGGYFFGLFGTQTSRAQVSIRSVTLVDSAANVNVTLTLELQNAGGLGDTISAISMPGTTTFPCTLAADCDAGFTAYPNDIGANVGSFTTVWDAGTQGTFSIGQTVSFTIRMSSGLVIPVAVSVS